jgi:hypothetical protein
MLMRGPLGNQNAAFVPNNGGHHKNTAHTWTPRVHRSVLSNAANALLRQQGPAWRGPVYHRINIAGGIW